MQIICPLCLAPDLADFAIAGGKRYFRCARCDVVVLDRNRLPSAAEEKAEYALHRNEPDDPRYRAHLARLTDPLLRHLPVGARGLDFGCGPGPAISAILGERDLAMRDYDPFFRPDRAALHETYDFVTCTEAAEHFHWPAREFALFQRLLRPGGLLGLMTLLRPDAIDFRRWWYAREPSHVTFYSARTLHWLAAHLGWDLRILDDRVAIFRRGG